MIDFNDIFADKDLLEKLNSMTKYPSILTYNAIGGKGGMARGLCNDEGFPANTILEATEKIDGTNTRMVVIGNDYVIGSRTQFIHAKYDRIINDKQTITCIDALREVKGEEGYMYVIYGEAYGAGIQEGSKVYVAQGDATKFRIFDIYKISLDEVEDLLHQPQNVISSWRDNNKQSWFTTKELQDFCDAFHVDRTPVVKTFNSNEMPTEAPDVYEFLKNFSESQSLIGSSNGIENLNKKYGRAEGIVIRTPNRSFIRKLRFEDYRKGEMQGLWK
jgi:conserved hypothetical protein